MKINFLFIFFFISIICKGQQSATLVVNWNDHIAIPIRKDINKLNKKVISAFYNNNSNELISLFSERMRLNNLEQTPLLTEAAHKIFKSSRYSILDEYQIKNSNIGSVGTVFKSFSNENDYKVNYNIRTELTYISLLIYSGPITQWLITVIYGFYGNHWEIQELFIGQYKVLKKNSIAYFELAQNDYREGNLIGAANNLLISKVTQNPGGNAFSYFKQPEINSFRNIIEQKLKNINFPIIVSQIPSSPQIFGIDPIINKNGVFPCIKYVSKIKIKDTINLKKENNLIQGILENILPKITVNKRYIFFKAYNRTNIIDDKTTFHEFILKK